MSARPAAAHVAQRAERCQSGPEPSSKPRHGHHMPFHGHAWPAPASRNWGRGFHIWRETNGRTADSCWVRRLRDLAAPGSGDVGDLSLMVDMFSS